MFIAKRLRPLVGISGVAMGTLLGAISLSGCERKETVLDVETPGADIEVERNVDTGQIDVEATDRD
jgi:hypothetical protein